MVSAVTNTSTTAATGTAASTASAASDPNAAQDRFLKLLVAQLNNQDPMNPMDNAQMTSQMAQINTVTGIQQLNQTVKSLTDQFSSLQMLQAAPLVGKNVLVEGSAIHLDNGVGKGAFDLPLAADNVKVEISTTGGQVVGTVDLGSLPAGRQSFAWDGSQYSGTDGLKFKVVATQGNKPVTSTALEVTRVLSVSNGTGGLTLQAQGHDALAYSSVKAVY